MALSVNGPLVWSAMNYRNQRERNSEAGAVRLGSAEFDRVFRSKTGSAKLPMWRDYSTANISRPLRNFVSAAADFEKRPVLLLGNGPSFHAHLEQISRLRRDGWLMVATDRVLPRLWRRGVLPDYVVSMDSGDQVLPYMEGTPAPYLAALEASGWVEQRQGRYTLARSRDDWLRLQTSPDQLGSAHPLLSTAECRAVHGSIFGEAAGARWGWIAEKAGLALNPIPHERMRYLLSVSINPHLGEWLSTTAAWFLPDFDSSLNLEIEELTGLKALPTGGNTGMMALNLCVVLGASPICLLGLDFSNRLDPRHDIGPRGMAPSASVEVPGSLPDMNLLVYAQAATRLMTHPRLAGLYSRSGVINFSGGILHGSFLARGRMEELEDRLVLGTPSSLTDPSSAEQTPQARLETFARYRCSLGDRV